MKARKDCKEPGYSRDTVQGGGLQEGGGTTRHQVTSTTGDGRHMVTPCGFPDGHYKEAGYRKTQQRDQTS